VYTAHPCMFSVDPLITYLFITHAMLDQVGVDVRESGFSSQESRKNLLEIYSKCKWCLCGMALMPGGIDPLIILLSINNLGDSS
jgi:hypothetical protein